MSYQFVKSDTTNGSCTYRASWKASTKRPSADIAGIQGGVTSVSLQTSVVINNRQICRLQIGWHTWVIGSTDATPSREYGITCNKSEALTVAEFGTVGVSLS